MLVQDRQLLAALDQWLVDLDDESFIELLPMLRRGFAEFAISGRQRILSLVGSGLVADRASPSSAGSELSPEFVEQALPLLRTILGIEA